ncbi:MAG: ABC transporter ATP-binding protein [Anaerolineae bacterium]|nr:ABC transporter ATP-binding protein [Anaerolineae bacterium]
MPELTANLAETGPLLSYDQVSFGYTPGGKSVLRTLSLDVQPGTVTAVLGPNGAGKTTLLHLTLGWLKPQRGQVRLAGRPLGSYGRRALGQWMALVPQTERIPFEYSVMEYVLMGRSPYLTPLAMPGADDYRIGEMVIQQVGLSALRDRPITTLSGGERQLATAARALAQQPRLLLLDEPTAHLDLANKARLIRLLRDLTASGMTLILTTHEPDVAAAIATHVVLIVGGQVFRAGSLAEVFTSDNLSAAYGLPVRVTRLDGQQIVQWQ